MRYRCRSRSSILAALALLISSQTCRGDELIGTINIGFDGHYQVGRWSPIQVEYEAPDVADWRLVVVVPDPDGHPTRRTLADGASPAGTATGQFRTGRQDQSLQVQLIAGDAVLDSVSIPASDAAANRPLTIDSSLWLLVGHAGMFQRVHDWLDERAAATESVLPREVVAVHREDTSLLPSAVEDYESVELVVIVGDYDMTDVQSEALRQWVERGGRLVTSIGSHHEEFRESDLADWCPVELGRGQTFTTLSPLSTLVASSSGLGAFIERIEGVRLVPNGNPVLAGGAEGPLLVRAAHGLGTVTCSAFDLDYPVVEEWDSAPELALTLADMPDLSQMISADSADAGGAVGTAYSELQTQLATVVDQYAGVSPISNFMVLGFLTAYLIGIGLIDYVLVHRWLKRPQWTWVTLPVWLTCGILVADGYAKSHSRPDDAARRVELIDVVADTQQVRIRDWVGLYSPDARRQDIQETIDSSWIDGGNLSLTWAGIPESSFRGMYRQAGLSLGDPDYDYDSETLGLAGFPRLPNASRVVEGEAWINSTELIESNLRDDGVGQLEGSFTHHLPVPITDWFVAYRNTAYYSLDETPIPPGVEFSIEGFPHPVVKSYLTNTRGIGVRTSRSRTDVRITRDAYDPSADADPGNILRMISFHAAADGSDYTTLENHYLEQLELTRLLDLKRAVVFGRIDVSAVSLQLDGEPVEADTTTYVRLIIPVEAE